MSNLDWKNPVIEVFVSSEAESDIENGVEFYETKNEGLGDYFQASVLSDLASLERLGGSHSTKFNLHRKLCSVFPYWIYYRMESRQSLTVVAIVGQRRGDEYVKLRLHGD